MLDFDNVTGLNINSNDLIQLSIGGDIVWRQGIPEDIIYLTFKATYGNLTVTPSIYWDAEIKEYSLDGGVTWTTYTSGSITGNMISFRGQNGTTASAQNSGIYTRAHAWELETTESDNYIFAGGDVGSVISYLDLTGSQFGTDAFNSMFLDQTKLVTPPRLSATTLSNGCYSSMFQGCTSLTIAPELPAKNLKSSCYYSMFENCTSLISIPRLRAVEFTTENFNCYEAMFRGCTKIGLSQTESSTYYNPFRIPVIGTGTKPSSYDFDYWSSYMFSNTGGTFTGDLQLNTVYYLNVEQVPAKAPVRCTKIDIYATAGQPIYYYCNTNGLYIDWGDETTSVGNGTIKSKTYSTTGNYTVTFPDGTEYLHDGNNLWFVEVLATKVVYEQYANYTWYYQFPTKSQSSYQYSTKISGTYIPEYFFGEYYSSSSTYPSYKQYGAGTLRNITIDASVVEESPFAFYYYKYYKPESGYYKYYSPTITRL